MVWPPSSLHADHLAIRRRKGEWAPLGEADCSLEPEAGWAAAWSAPADAFCAGRWGRRPAQRGRLGSRGTAGRVHRTLRRHDGSARTARETRRPGWRASQKSCLAHPVRQHATHSRRLPWETRADSCSAGRGARKAASLACWLLLPSRLCREPRTRRCSAGPVPEHALALRECRRWRFDPVHLNAAMAVQQRGGTRSAMALPHRTGQAPRSAHARLSPQAPHSWSRKELKRVGHRFHR